MRFIRYLFLLILVSRAMQDVEMQFFLLIFHFRLSLHIVSEWRTNQSDNSEMSVQCTVFMLQLFSHLQELILNHLCCNTMNKVPMLKMNTNLIDAARNSVESTQRASDEITHLSYRICRELWLSCRTHGFTMPNECLSNRALDESKLCVNYVRVVWWRLLLPKTAKHTSCFYSVDSLFFCFCIVA